MLSLITILYLILLSQRGVSKPEHCGEPERRLCTQQTVCDECVQASACCSYCYSSKTYSHPRCDFAENLQENGCQDIELTQNETRVVITEDNDFTDYLKEGQNVQIKPQHIKVYLRKDQRAKIDFYYHPAKNYPLDLYYLTDASYTMSHRLETLEKVAQKLADNMKKLTENFRIGLGMFSEKNVLPFSYTTKNILDEHCDTKNLACIEGYDFKHELDFTELPDEFITKVQSVKNKTTINIDEPEAALDALMQILLCEEQLNWNSNSRKIVVIATDGSLHMAGEGKLAGAVKKYAEKCSLNKDGYFSKSLEYDYPSLEDIFQQLLKKKVNVIFAFANKSLENYYNEVTQLMDGVAFKDFLKEDNVIQLVKSGYQKVISNVNFFINETLAEGLKKTFYSNCTYQTVGDNYVSCNDIKADGYYGFSVDLEVAEDTNDENVFYIEEQDLHEKIRVDVEYIGQKCKCAGERKKRDVNCNHGTYRCGGCVCDKGWSGEFCNEQCASNNLTMCRETVGDFVSVTCYGRGECACEKCECEEGFSGKYCQYECPRKYNKICSGNGKCDLGSCVCNPGYTGEVCSCPTSTYSCTAPGGNKVCNNKGTCQCGECQCNKGYTGKYCEKCPTCFGRCSQYDDCVIDRLKEEATNRTCIMKIYTKDNEGYKDLEDSEGECEVRYTKNRLTCNAVYKYRTDSSEMTSIAVTSKQCSDTLQAGLKYGGCIIGVILVVGIGVLMAWILIMRRKDRREWAKFENEREKYKNSREDNPLYKSPISQYTNPMKNASTANDYETISLSKTKSK